MLRYTPVKYFRKILSAYHTLLWHGTETVCLLQTDINASFPDTVIVYSSAHLNLQPPPHLHLHLSPCLPRSAVRAAAAASPPPASGARAGGCSCWDPVRLASPSAPSRAARPVCTGAQGALGPASPSPLSHSSPPGPWAHSGRLQ